MIMTKMHIRLWVMMAISIAFIVTLVHAEVNSVFPEDTCDAPCWFGIVPGESTSEHVENLITEHAIDDVEVYGEFDEETQHLITGVYEFELLKRENSSLFARVQIRDSIVYAMILRPTKPDRFPDYTPPNEYITLQQTLTRLGQPDIIYFDEDHSHFGNHSFPHVTFIYPASRLRIEFEQSPYPLASCSLQSVGDDMFLENIRYYSPDAANELSHYVGHDELQPTLTALTLGDELVTTDMWQQVIRGEIEEPCRLMPTVYDNPITAPIIYDEPTILRSLFDEDTCLPPCWMGLTPGESTSEDVGHLIRNTTSIFREWTAYEDSVFDEQTGLIISGGYASNWLLLNRGDFASFNSRISISIDDGIVQGLLILPQRTILLRSVLEALGTPAYMTLSWHEVGGYQLSLYYFEYNIHISLASIRQCNIARMSNNFWVRYIDYSPSIRPRLRTDSKVVPLETWQQWVNGEETRSCRTAWNELAESP